MINKLRAELLLSLLVCFTLFAQAQDKIRVACIGNSITYGAGIANRFQNSYPAILQQMLGKDYDVRNFGVSATVVINRGDHPYVLETAYKQAREFNPNIVTIKLGTNDSKPQNWRYKQDYEKDLTRIVDELSSLPAKPKIYLCLPVPAYEDRWGITENIIHGEIAPLIKNLAKKRHLEVIDLHTPMSGKPEKFSDGIHPNAEGAKDIAEVIYKSLTGKDANYSFDANQPFPGRKSDYHGYARYDFYCRGYEALVVVPEKPLKGKPWVWRPAFFGAFPTADLALLKEGYYIAYFDATYQHACPRSIENGKYFYDMMCQNYGLSDKVFIEGLSRGGYYAFNWAARYPECTAGIYVDAPVCNILSWPGRGRKDLWDTFLKEWNVQDADVNEHFRGNVMELLPKLAKAKVPVFVVYGEADKTVVPEENILPVFEQYRAMGGPIEIVGKPGCDHHPHGLEDPEPVIDFMNRHCKGYEESQSIAFRNDLSEAFAKFRSEKKGNVTFLGGSITEMKGWHQMIMEDLKQRFPETEFTFNEAGIASMGSTPHAFRFEHDVLEKQVPDLLFVEAAVNDYVNHFDAIAQVRGMEGVIRHALKANPKMDIVMLHFICDEFVDFVNKDMMPDVVYNHERVANRYGITSINLVKEIGDRMKAGEFDWKKFGGTHPSWFGHKFYAAAINRVFDWTFANGSQANARYYNEEAPIDEACYDNGKFVALEEAKDLKGFTLVPNWNKQDGKSTRKNFVDVPMLEATKAGASLKLDFNGNAVGICCVAGPKAGVLSYRIDNGETKTLDTYTEWSHYLYLPWVYMFETNLPKGPHTLYLKIEKGERTECQIRNFVVNE